jgi:hypothetical protein
LALAIVTGALLFSVRSGHYASGPAALVKVLLIVIGLANVLVFRRAKARPSGGSPSVTMRLNAMCSMAVWICAVFAGRWTAFTS